ncbi:MAG: metallophosphoesterase [Clostridia bacterium]
MATFAISDLHLSFGVDKPMNVFGKLWQDYEKKIEENWQKQIKENDFVIVPGDISWGMNFKEALPDFEFLNKLPGHKIFLRGNHDYYFSTKTKVKNFLEQNNFSTLQVLHNDAIDTPEYIICGSRGWGKNEINDLENDKKIIFREKNRLRMSLEVGKKIKEEYFKKGINKEIIVAMHFPPFLKEFQEVLKDYDIKKCIYGHLHGYGHTMIKEGSIDNIQYVMVSCDYTNFSLKRL